MMKVILVVALLQTFLHICQAGSCWGTMESTGRCTGLIHGHISSKEDCCKMGKNLNWHDADVNDEELMIRGGPMSCEPCKVVDDCTNHKCNDDEVCRMQQDGSPVCDCEYQCAHQEDNWICGTDGRPYRNPCELKHANCHHKEHVAVAYTGMCKDSCDKIQCEEFTQCVTNRSTSHHVCVPCDKICESTVRNVFCGTDGQTYENECQLQQQNCYKKSRTRFAYLGECQAAPKCSSVTCPRGLTCLPHYQPPHLPTCYDCTTTREDEKSGSVCGANGITYSTVADLKRASCSYSRLIEKRDKAHCKKKAHG